MLIFARHLSTSAILLCAYWGLLFIGTHVPGSAMPGGVSVSDKLLHVTSYFILSVMFFRWILESRGFRQSWPIVVTILLFYGLLDELTQVPIPGRYCELSDFVADGIGIFSGALFYGVLVQLKSWVSVDDSDRD